MASIRQGLEMTPVSQGVSMSKVHPDLEKPRIWPGLGSHTARARRALRMVPNFSFSRDEVTAGNSGSCYVNSRLMMLSCYIIKYGADALLNFDTSKSFKDPDVAEATLDGNEKLIAVVTSYLDACRKSGGDQARLKDIYRNMARILFHGDSTICSDVAYQSFYRIVHHVPRGLMMEDGVRMKHVMCDDDYRTIIRREQERAEREHDFLTEFMLVISGEGRGHLFIPHHETFLMFHAEGWMLFDDLDCLNSNKFSGRSIREAETFFGRRIE